MRLKYVFDSVARSPRCSSQCNNLWSERWCVSFMRLMSMSDEAAGSGSVPVGGRAEHTSVRCVPAVSHHLLFIHSHVVHTYTTYAFIVTCLAPVISIYMSNVSLFLSLSLSPSNYSSVKLIAIQTILQWNCNATINLKQSNLWQECKIGEKYVLLPMSSLPCRSGCKYVFDSVAEWLL